jgi:L-aspartate oxidase
LVAAVLGCPSVSILSGTQALRVLVDDGNLSGVLVEKHGHYGVLPTCRVVMATGGIGGLFDATTNPVGNYGQGVMMAARAGAALADMEFIQFHPTALDVPRAPLPLISEAVRGEGAVLVNGRGERFMAGVPNAELAARDVVARAIHSEIARGGRVYLDPRPVLGDSFGERFPGIDRICRAAGLDPCHQPIPVRPAAHYHMGGSGTDAQGRTSVAGLWAVGECAATGLHGANRLASNSLLEAVVMARRAAQDIGGYSALKIRRDEALCDRQPPVADPGMIRPIVSRYLSLLRDAEGLREAIGTLLPLVDGQDGAADPAVVALSVATFAIMRQESRGAHARCDHPQQSPDAVSRKMTLKEIKLAAQAQLFDPLLRSA